MGALDKLMMHDLQLANRFKLSFNDNEDLEIFIKSTDIPLEGFTYDTLPFGKKEINAIKPVETITFTFYETPDFAVYKFFKEWQEDFYDFDKKAFKVLNEETDKYKDASIKTIYYDFSYTEREGKSFYLRDLCPVSINTYTFDETNGEPIETVVECSVNEVTDKLNNTQSNYIGV